MKLNKLFLPLALMLPLAFSACSDKEDDLMPSEPEKNLFEVDFGKTDPESVLRKKFYDETGVYLLFNDTVARYTDSSGIPRVETMDFNWDYTDTSNSSYRLEFLENQAEKEQAANVIKRFLLPYINFPGGKMRPFALVLAKNIETYNSRRDRWSQADFLSAFQGMVFRVQEEWIEGDDNEVKELIVEFLHDLITDELDSYADELDDFFNVCYDCYDAYYIAEYDSEWLYEQDIEFVYQCGFLKYYKKSDPEDDMFPSRKNDLNSYYDAMFNQTEEEFKQQWADYPVILQKYDLLKKAIVDFGIDLNATVE